MFTRFVRLFVFALVTLLAFPFIAAAQDLGDTHIEDIDSLDGIDFCSRPKHQDKEKAHHERSSSSRLALILSVLIAPLRFYNFFGGLDAILPGII